jgi:nitrogen fixation protein NifX
MAHRIALASTNGKAVDQHFRQADRFEIVDLEEDRYIFVETRRRQIGNTPGHDTGAFDDIVRLLQDCEGVFVSQIGVGAARYLHTVGLRVFEAPYPVEGVLEKVLADRVFAPQPEEKNNETEKEKENHDASK